MIRCIVYPNSHRIFVRQITIKKSHIMKKFLKENWFGIAIFVAAIVIVTTMKIVYPELNWK